jgi:two-component system phosphate regulon response regulator PhoB
MISKTILVIDDSADIGELIRGCLRAFQVDQAFSMAEAHSAMAKAKYDMFIIDVRLPDGSGFDMCLELTGDPAHAQTPKIILTAMDEITEKVYGFNCGADDYITKPFHAVELRARVERHLLRMSMPNGVVSLLPGLELDIEFQKCHVTDGEQKQEVSLTQTEFRLLLILHRNQGRVLSRQDLEKMAWQAYGSTIEQRGIDTHIAHLRKKLGPFRESIASIYGQGYTLKKTVA